MSDKGIAAKPGQVAPGNPLASTSHSSRAAGALARREEQAGDASKVDDRLRAAALDRARQKSVPRSRPSGFNSRSLLR